MTDQTTNSVNIRILERDYQFSTPPEEEDRLREASQLLNQRMKEIRNSGRVVGTERIAVMAALNMANDLLHAKARDDVLEGDVSNRLKMISERVENALGASQQLDL